MSLGTIFFIIFSAIFIENFVFSRFLGICPFLGMSKKLDTAIGMGGAVIFVMTLASMVTWLVQKYVLEPYKVEFLQTIAFILVIAALVQFIEMFLQKSMPDLYSALGIYLPLITTNCCVFAVTLLNINKNYSFIESAIFGLAAGVGFTLALILMAGVREKLDLADIPDAMKGLPIAFITASLMSLAFMGFSGMKIG